MMCGWSRDEMSFEITNAYILVCRCMCTGLSVTIYYVIDIWQCEIPTVATVSLK